MNDDFPKPDNLGPDVKFFDVNGVPVALLDEVEPINFGLPQPEIFDWSSLANEGVEITREKFLAMVKK